MRTDAELYRQKIHIIRMASIVNIKQKAIFDKICSDDPLERKDAEFRLCRKFEEDFLTGSEDYQIRSYPDGQAVFQHVFQKVLTILRDKGSENFITEKLLNLLFEGKLMEELANILNHGDYLSIRRTERYLARRLGDVVNYWRFKGLLWERHDRVEAFDDSLLMLLTNIRTRRFQGETRLETYFSTIFQRACIGKLRQKKLKKNLPAHPWPGLDRELIQTLEIQAWEQLKSRLNELDPDAIGQKLQFFAEKHPKCFHIFYLHHANELTYAEIAGIMKAASADSVKTEVARCKKRWLKVIRETGLKQ
jgi:DNA-directed RNA polymerase specialized sigma24 family protein